MLYAESTNASRTFLRDDGASDHEKIVIDEQVDMSLDGAWGEACAKLTEKMREFLESSAMSGTTSVAYTFKANSVADGVSENIKMFIVDYMMADWLASVRPDFRKRYVDRCNMQIDDLLRKLYKKQPPV